MDVNVFLVNSEEGNEETFNGLEKVSDVIEHLQRKYPGKYPGSELRIKYYDQQLKADQLLSNLSHKGEDGILELLAIQTEYEDGDKLRGSIMSLDSRIAFRLKGSKTTKFLEPGEAPFEFKTGFFRRLESFIVFRDTNDKKAGESIYNGFCYNLPKDEKILRFEVDNEGVFKVTKNRERILIEPAGETDQAYEGDFTGPGRDDTWFGKSLPVDFKNKTGKRILTVSGGPRNFSTFDLEPVRGDEDRAINIKIKKGPKDFKVGLTTKSSSDAAGNPIYVANMYIVPPGIKRIEIEDFEIEDTKDQGHKVTAIMANGDRTNVGLDKTKTFRVVDKYYWRDTLTKAATLAVGGAIGSAIGSAISGVFGTGGEIGEIGEIGGTDVVDHPEMPSPRSVGPEEPMVDC